MQSRFMIITALILTFGLAGCSKDDSSTPDDPQTVKDSLSEGAWRITYYWDSDHEETYHFTGYTFDFGDNGVVTATSGTTTVTGTWSTLTDDSTLKLVLFFASPSDFEELSDDWKILESTDKKIRLEDVSGGGGGTDYLTFEKN